MHSWKGRRPLLGIGSQLPLHVVASVGILGVLLAFMELEVEMRVSEAFGVKEPNHEQSIVIQEIKVRLYCCLLHS